MEKARLEDGFVFFYFVRSAWRMAEIDRFINSEKYAMPVTVTAPVVPVAAPVLPPLIGSGTSGSSSSGVSGTSGAPAATEVEKSTLKGTEPKKYIKRKQSGQSCQIHRVKHMRCPDNCPNLQKEQRKPVILRSGSGKRYREYIVNKIVSHRELANGTVEYLVNWAGYSSSENTWEPYRSFVRRDGSLTEQLQVYLKSV